jgi:hypothetical protein
MNVTLNGSSISYKPGIIFNEKLNENLDIGMLIIPQSTVLSIEPMDQVVISDTAFTKYMLVADIKRTTSRFHAPKQYNYTLNLVSPTIQLQRIVLPNRKITQPLTGTKFDIYTKLSQYMQIYAPDYTLSAELIALTTGVICPELQWNRPTLFEVFNDLLSEVDAVVTMTDFSTISYLDLNIQGSAISDDDLSEVEEEQNIQEYANKIEAEVQNAFQDNTNTRVVEWITPKTDSDAIVTTSNAKLILEKPIDKITKVIARICIVDFSFDILEADITNYVVEKSAYDLLEPSNSTENIQGDYKRSHLYYVRETNIIDGLCYQESTWLPALNSPNAIRNVFRNAYYDATSVDIGSNLSNADVLNFVFKIEYQALDTVKLMANKDTAFTNKSVLINNQDTSYVDFLAFANRQQNTVERIGQPKMTIIAKYSSYGDMPSLGDYYDTDYKLSEREYAIYDTYINFKGTLNKYYVLKDLYTGLKSQRRFTALASAKDSVESNHINEYDLIFQKTDYTSSSLIENHMLKFGEAGENIKLIYLRFFNEANFSSGRIGISPSAYYTNKSVLLTYKMYDNFSAGYQTTKNEQIFNNYIAVKTVPYTDNNGNFDFLNARLYKKYAIPVLNQSSITLGPQWGEALGYSRQLPEIDVTLLDSNDFVYEYFGYRFKDNREITAETIQFNFLSDAGIFLGHCFFKDNPLVYAESTDKTLYVAYSATLTYSKGDQIAKGTIADPAHLAFTKTANRIYISSPDSSIDTSEFASWAICDDDGNIYIANNGTNTSVYLNKLSGGLEEVVDSIVKQAYFSNEGLLDVDYIVIEIFLESAEFSNSLTLDVSHSLLEVYNYNVSFSNELIFNATYSELEIKNYSIISYNNTLSLGMTYSKIV